MTYTIRAAGEGDLDGARHVMLDTFYRDLGHGYVPRWHADVVDPRTAYLAPARHALFVAILDGEVVATTGVRAEGPRCPPHPAWLVERYPSGSTAQLFRVYVRPEHRRHGLARALVGEACAFVARAGGYSAIYLHTDTRVPGAEAFWRSQAKQVHADRDASPVVHFEIPIRESPA
ncbi:N-acetyltransferase [Longispora fulva]|uniref:GNAT superfamily N-acetyltransferase n=1 Tax=Longispora fulva TaxID=619741 RepID=A0A8J7GHI9_9ACTN|nr:GNAT family N-acetyltransferase [Longispora fulva]MBG6136388.1 GNAT superfamily N-acetyltransferase [Longispora fulva]GIG59556.1 N-acetyltransferase [Longispora fulva]